jgi:mannonate dehydratase
MRRRDFFELSAALAAAQAPGARAATPPIRMKLGSQHADTDAILKTMAAFGVNHICVRTPSKVLDENWSVEGLTRLREHIESFGLTAEMIEMPTNSALTTSAIKNVLIGKSPERDREIDAFCQMLRNVSRAGIPRAKYNLTILMVERTEPTPGRGGAMYSTWDYERAQAKDPPLTEAGPVSADAAWEHITYFLERVAPAAQEYKVKIACHPHDPAIPGGKPFRGVHRVMASVDGLKRFVSIKENPYHGLNFCQGTVSEMLDRPGEQIYDVIRYFGERNKIFNVHFRNIKGHIGKFQETFPDNGDVDMARALRVYRDVGYDGMMMPDHAPHIEGDQGARQAYAFEFGYIAALIKTLG